MGKGSAPRPYSVDSDTFESNWDKIFKKENINLTEEELANVLIIEDIVKHHRKKQNSDGEHVGGISGTLMSIGHAIKNIDPTRVIIVLMISL